MTLSLFPGRSRAEAGEAPSVARSAVAVLTVAVVLVSGFFAGRLTSAQPSASAPAPGLVAPTPADERPGPTRTSNGVPVGYAHTPEGAVAAATGYLTTISDKRAFSRDWREDAYRVMAAPDSYGRLIDSVRPSYDRIAADLALDDAVAYNGSVLAMTVPIGYRVDDYTDGRATVTVWAAAWLTRPTGQQLPLRAHTTTVELVWTDGDWKLDRVRGSRPLDPPGVAAPPTIETLREMSGFQRFRSQPVESS